MRNSDAPIVKDLVLLGGGHSHVAVLKGFGMAPIPGARLILICRDVHTPYSGMLPGLIAGHYSFDDAHIDLEKLARFARAEFIRDAAVGLDLKAKRVLFDARPPIPYDVLSINVGSTPNVGAVPGAAEHAIPVKPISRFLPYWERLSARVLHATGDSRIAVVGGGAGGIELLLSVQYRLRNLLRERGVDQQPEFHLFSSSMTLPRGVERKFRRILAERGVALHLGSRVVEVFADGLLDGDGARYEIDEILWTTEAAAPPWPREAGLAVDDRGFIKVADTLQSVSHAGVFAAGDVAAMVNHPRPKAGVFAVRQGPPLEANLRRAMLGRDPRPFRPQRTYLSLISTGDRYAVGSKGPLTVEGAWLWRWKDWIDRKFMRKFGDELPAMPAGARRPHQGLAISEAFRDPAMRCAGCGSKLGARVLDRALAKLSPLQRDDVKRGLVDRDDAAAFAVPCGRVAVQSVDFFPALVDDLHLFGKIAARHALGDLHAMGAIPHSALAIAVVRRAAEEKMEDALFQMLSGAEAVLREEGATLLGGHSSEGDEAALGLTVNGLADPAELLGKTGLQPGDRLILTKPLGVGTLFAAAMRLKAQGRWISAAIESMLLSNAAAAAVFKRRGVRACTDVTGFGLLGHLAEMTRASGVGARVRLDELPILDGARETVAAGWLSSLQPDNLRLRRSVANDAEASKKTLYPLLFDPQTSGGLLAAVPADEAEQCLAELTVGGYPRAAIIGEAAEGAGLVEIL